MKFKFKNGEWHTKIKFGKKKIRVVSADINTLYKATK